MLPDFDRADRIVAYWATPRHPRGARRGPDLPLSRRSFQYEGDDRERSDYYGDDDDDPDADCSDHPTTPRHHEPPTRLCETLTRTGLELLTARLRDLTAKTHPRRTPDRLRGGPGAPGRVRGDGPRRPTQGSRRTNRKPSLWATRVAKPGPVSNFPWRRLAWPGFGMISFPPVLGPCFGVLVFTKTRRPRRLRGGDGVMNLKEMKTVSPVLTSSQTEQPPLCASVRECRLRSANGHSSSER